MFSAISLAASTAILFFVLRYRVHVHVTYTPRPSTRSTRSAREAGRRVPEPSRPIKAAPVRAEGQRAGVANLGGGSHGLPLASDLESALVNLGTKKAIARKAAERAMYHQDADFTAALRRAIDYARCAA